MKGIINIIATIIVVTCMHACKAHRVTQTSEQATYTGSVNKVEQRDAVELIGQWSAQQILQDATGSTWTKVKIYDTTKPGNPLIVDIERKDTASIQSKKQKTDSTIVIREEACKDSITIDEKGEKKEYKETETAAEERLSDILRGIAKIAFLILIIYGLIELAKKLG